MLHAIKPDEHGPMGEAMARAVQTCVHCGFCLPACPTYRAFGAEPDSPRGRIVLMKQVLEGEIHPAAAQVHIDRCLGCLACEPACPSGVAYRDLISPFRSRMETERRFGRRPFVRLGRWLVAKTLPDATRFRRALTLARLARPFRFALPPTWRAMVELAPSALPPAVSLPELSPAIGAKRGRVALLVGCAQQVIDPDINVATIEVLNRNGIEVVIPRDQGCCGGLAWHTGNLGDAQKSARRNLAAFPADVDAIVTNAAGCGSAMHEYPLMLRGTKDEARAEAVRARVCDVSAYLARIGLGSIPAASGRGQKVAYHDACHLANAQGVKAEPRKLLQAIPGLDLVEIADAEFCCGSAGTYNLDQPETAARLGEDKARAIIATGAATVATGNIGCATQLNLHLQRLGRAIAVRHTMQVLRDAYRRGASR